MILDCRYDAFIGPMILVIDAATAEPVERHPDLMYLDTEAGIYRVAARDEDGDLIRGEDGEITWTEHSHPLRVIPNPDLDDTTLDTVVRWLEEREREGPPDFSDKPPVTLDDAMHEVKIEDACVELRLGDDAAEFVMASYRFSPSFLRTILEHGADHRCYVECKLILRAKMNGDPEPTFPPRPLG
jgi:hypothetical protein